MLLLGLRLHRGSWCCISKCERRLMSPLVPIEVTPVHVVVQIVVVPNEVELITVAKLLKIFKYSKSPNEFGSRL